MAFHDFSMEQIDGTPRNLGDYRGKVCLVVNVASQCGLTPQYGALQALYERFAERGFEVLGFPANEFGAQEPGSNGEIQTFCQTRYGVSFPMFAKIPVKGPHMHPLYRWLLENGPRGDDIEWNFAKFLIGKDGEILERFAPTTAPDAPEVIAAIESALSH
jgi:glutathione peroxidase